MTDISSVFLIAWRPIRRILDCLKTLCSLVQLNSVMVLINTCIGVSWRYKRVIRGVGIQGERHSFVLIIECVEHTWLVSKTNPRFEHRNLETMRNSGRNISKCVMETAAELDMEHTWKLFKLKISKQCFCFERSPYSKAFHVHDVLGRHFIPRWLAGGESSAVGGWQDWLLDVELLGARKTAGGSALWMLAFLSGSVLVTGG